MTFRTTVLPLLLLATTMTPAHAADAEVLPTLEQLQREGKLINTGTGEFEGNTTYQLVWDSPDRYEDLQDLQDLQDLDDTEYVVLDGEVIASGPVGHSTHAADAEILPTLELLQREGRLVDTGTGEFEGSTTYQLGDTVYTVNGGEVIASGPVGPDAEVFEDRWVTAPQVVHNRENFDAIPSNGTITVFASDRNLRKRFANLLPGSIPTYTSESPAVTLRKTNEPNQFVVDVTPQSTGPPAIVMVTVGEGRTTSATPDEYITVTFSDGAEVWYKQPRAMRMRDRSDVWVRGRSFAGPCALVSSCMEKVARTQRYVAAADQYPEQLRITIPNRPQFEEANTQHATI